VLQDVGSVSLSEPLGGAPPFALGAVAQELSEE
jgi:hypothetical protein